MVEAELFSGRPNPRWLLDEAAAAELRRLEAALRRARVAAPSAPPALGYRGFVYALAGVPHRAWHGQVTAGNVLLDDPGRSVERLLLATMPDEHAAAKERLAHLLTPDGAG